MATEFPSVRTRGISRLCSSDVTCVAFSVTEFEHYAVAWTVSEKSDCKVKRVRSVNYLIRFGFHTETPFW